MLPEVVIFLVLLVWWLDIPKNYDAPYQVIEYFAGVGRIAKLAQHVGYKAARVDIEYSKAVGQRLRKRSPMDLNSDAGLVYQARK